MSKAACGNSTATTDRAGSRNSSRAPASPRSLRTARNTVRGSTAGGPSTPPARVATIVRGRALDAAASSARSAGPTAAWSAR